MHKIIERWSTYFGLDSGLVTAIIKTESGGNKYAFRYEGKGRVSIGLMQILYPSTFRYLNSKVGNQFNFFSLFNPNKNIFLGCFYLSILSEKYSDTDDIIASYNAGKPIQKYGRYINQTYVNKVRSYYV